jgi:hypothetical protein
MHQLNIGTEVLQEKIVIGIDPGVRTAIVLIKGRKIINVFTPVGALEYRRVWRWIRKFKKTHVLEITMEKVMHGIRGKGREKLYESFYWHKHYLELYQLPFKLVAPIQWKTQLKLKKDKNNNKLWEDSRNYFINSHKFLKVKTKDHDKSAACMIAMYKERKNG